MRDGGGVVREDGDVGEVYADHAATTPPAPEVRAAMAPWLAGLHGNASSVHHLGERARDAVETARAQVASLVHALPEEVVFTASGSEANNLALKGTLALMPPDRRRIVISAIEHPSVLETARALQATGAGLDIVPVDAGGIVDPDDLARRLGPDVAIVSVMAVNNEIGTLQPIADIARAARAAGARMHCDAVQAAGRLPLDFAALGLDLMTLAAHKLGGPLGAAALVVRRRTR
ncbi:MAG TPA: aminotransferase class V-fold PLP-dependent enzyme, partial [Candidatus Eisenbacteria bacterium]|nr:aminotransferase class V-fold PLP-dependent enzyme [Candidatus Eisenbacteria bacterium]